jgi:ABC-type iron transport system FetAB ATPase subunit
VLEVQGLTRPGIVPFSLRVEAGECVALSGPSGAGKTLLLRAIADLDPCFGAVALDGVDRDTMSAPRWRQSVGYLAPESGWWEDGVGAHFPDRDRATALLPALGLPLEALDWQVQRLSTGERQRLALARLLLVGPKVMLLDEPTSGLDPDSAALVEGLLTQRLDDGAAIILVTHAAEQMQRMAARHFRMEMGRLSEVGAGS